MKKVLFGAQVLTKFCAVDLSQVNVVWAKEEPATATKLAMAICLSFIRAPNEKKKMIRVPAHDGSDALDLPPRCPVVSSPVGKPTFG
jgi:hypothetical protein